MPQRKPFPPEHDTRPNRNEAKTVEARRSSPLPKSARERAEAPTIPPPPKQKPKTKEQEPTGRPRGKSVSNVRAARAVVNVATVDEVTADLSKDPRRDRD
jgi:hypothetical protein